MNPENSVSFQFIFKLGLENLKALTMVRQGKIEQDKILKHTKRIGKSETTLKLSRED